MQNQKTFYLASTEGPREGHPWKCNPIMRIVWVAKYTRDDGMLVSVSSSIAAGVYGNADDIKELVVFSRHMGESLFPMSSWPIFVNICIINTDHLKVTGRAEEGDLAFCDIGIMGDLEQVNKWRYRNRFEQDQ